MTQVSDYLSLITSEHQKPKFLAMVSVLAQWAVDRQNLLQSIRGTEAVPGAVTLDVVPSADASFYRTDWQGRQLLYATPRTNYAYPSIMGAGWSPNLSPVLTQNAILYADGVTEVPTMTATRSTEGFFCNNGPAVPAGEPYVDFFDLKQVSGGQCQVLLGSNEYDVVFDLNTKAFTSFSGNLSGQDYVELDNGWIRVWLSVASPDSEPQAIFVYGASNPTAITVGVGGIQRVGGTGVPSSYIPTTTAPVTVTDYVLGETGGVTLGQVPVAGAQITWSGDATVLANGGPVQASNALLGVGDGSTSKFQAALTWGTQAGTPESPGLYDIDIAVDQQLDRVGEWVGISRQLAIPLTNVYFSFDEAGLGFDQGAWLGPFDPTTGLTSLPDDVYRILLYAKIAANTWDGTIPAAYTAWNTIFEPLGYQILIQNNQDMTMDIALIGPAPDAVTLALFSGGYLSLVPAGVGVNNYYLQSVQGSPLFGFDAQNNSIAGFDTGAFAQILQ